MDWIEQVIAKENVPFREDLVNPFIELIKSYKERGFNRKEVVFLIKMSFEMMHNPSMGYLYLYWLKLYWRKIRI